MKVQFKTWGKKRLHSSSEMDFPSGNYSLSNLLAAVVRHELEMYQQNNVSDGNLPHLLAPEVWQQKIHSGKIAFDRLQDPVPVDEQTAIHLVLTAFTDGLFAVFINDRLIRRLDESIELQGQDTIVFIRLSLLSSI